MIDRITLRAQADTERGAGQNLQDIVSRIMAATMEVNPPGEWECTYDTIDQSPMDDQWYARQAFTFRAHDNVNEPERERAGELVDDNALD